MNYYTFLFEIFFYFFHIGLFAEESWSTQQHCSEQFVDQLKGRITSPEYPNPLRITFCSVWKIPLPPGTFLKIDLTDLDIASDVNCHRSETGSQCCQQNRLVLPGDKEGDPPHVLCGEKVVFPRTFTVYQRPANISFYHFNLMRGYRGFSLNYFTEFISKCGQDQFQCSNGDCIPLSMRCDSVHQCEGGEDELHCHPYSSCPKGEIPCDLNPKICYKPKDQCDGRFQCQFGEDEVGCVPGCEQRIACSSGEGCYWPAQRCDARSDCVDSSDEANCAAQLCVTLPDKRLCRNGSCIQARLWCDGSDDCGDASDEESCLQNSVITAAMMGALLGGLFLVLAVGYTIRYYGQRPSLVHSHVASQLRMRHSVSLPAHIDDEFFHREPPPAYSVAVADVCLLSSAPRQGRGRTRGRPLLSVRRQQGSGQGQCQGQAGQPKPPESNSVSASGQPQMPDTMSSTPPTTFCSDDTVQLISA